MPTGFFPMDTPPYSINEYVCDGQCAEKGIFLHVENAKIKVAESLDDFERYIQYLNRLLPEIRENWHRHNGN